MWADLNPFQKPELNLDLKSKVWLEMGMLKVAYEVSGDLQDILLPKPLLNPSRVIGLWESTCFEMFIMNDTDEQYLEFNVTSEYTWNVFYFPNKKARLKEYQVISNLGVSGVEKNNSYCLSFWLPIDKLPPNLWSSGNMKIGLSAVIERSSTELSYWALKHPDTKPNFHHKESFIYEL